MELDKLSLLQKNFYNLKLINTTTTGPLVKGTFTQLPLAMLPTLGLSFQTGAGVQPNLANAALSQSWNARTTGMCHHARLQIFTLKRHFSPGGGGALL